MRIALIALCLLFGSVSAIAQVSVGIGLPGVSIGINVPVYPEFVRVPGYPVYYAPRLNSNFFFYDGMYWVYTDDNWYASSWYNGPWALVGPEVVPLFILRIPVRYYRVPPPYFRGWRADAPPRWGEHWGNSWAQRRSGWDRWNRQAVPAAAPLPVYQRKYSGDRYPQAAQQREIHGQNYRYQPREAAVRQHYQEHAVQKAPAPERRQQAAPQERAPQPKAAAPEPRRERAEEKAPPAKAAAPEPRRERAEEKGPPAKAAAPEPRREKGEERGRDKGRDKGEERGQENKK